MNKGLALIAAIVVAASAMVKTDAQAATINGAIDIGGQVTVASTSSLLGVDFIGNGTVIATVGDFSSIAPATPVTLTDILFAAPNDIWEVGGFKFTATSFTDIGLNAQGGKDFTANGILTAAGFDPTKGTFLFSSQSSKVLASFSSSSIAEVSGVPIPAGFPLLLGGIAAIGALRLRRKRAA